MPMPLDHKPELLAPAGTIEALAAVFDAGADAAYIGGKLLNMRMHRASYNFDDRQMAAAIELAHRRQRRLYVTLNSLVLEQELPLVRSALATLGQLRPDGIIVQDLAIAALAREICVHVPLHASTMMNVHSVETATALQMLGFVRIVTSRDIPLHEVRRIGEATGIEMEYFIHGDMCIAESSQCYGSGLLFGESANRGRCLKSCRWKWNLVPPDGIDGLDEAVMDGYLLARKDLCLFQHIPALIQNGIASLKIEGRMRTPEFLVPLVSAYRSALDACFADPFGYATDHRAMKELYQRRVRDFSTSMSLGNPGRHSVDPGGTREPRLFSLAKRERDLTAVAPPPAPVDATLPELVVRVSTPEAAQAAADAGANAVYLGGDCFVSAGRPLEWTWLKDFAGEAASRGIRTAVLGTRIADERDLAEFRWLLSRIARIRNIGVGVSTLGSLQIAREQRFRDIIADFSMNIANSQAADELSTQGATRVTASLELETPDLADFVRESRLPVEVIGQGPLPSMVMDHCIIAAATGHTAQDVCPMNCRKGDWVMRDTAGQDHRIECDRRCRNHLYMARDLCVLPAVRHLAQLGVSAIRIEAPFDTPEAVRSLTAAYREAIDRLNDPSWQTDPAELAALSAQIGRPMSDGLHAFDAALETGSSACAQRCISA